MKKIAAALIVCSLVASVSAEEVQTTLFQDALQNALAAEENIAQNVLPEAPAITPVADLLHQMNNYDEGQNVMVHTGDNNISCNLYFPSREETLKLFFIPELQECLSRLQEKESITSKAHSFINDLFDRITNHAIPRDTFEFEPAQQTVLDVLADCYQPVAVSIINLSDHPIVLAQSAYLGNVSSSLVSPDTVLKTYPNMNKLEQTGVKRTIVYLATGAASLALSGLSLSYAGSVLGPILGGLIGLPGAALVGTGAHRYATTHKPLTEVGNHYRALDKRAHDASAYLLDDNVTRNVRLDETYEIPGRSVFTELIFFDKHQLEQRNSLTNTELIYSVPTNDKVLASEEEEQNLEN